MKKIDDLTFIDNINDAIRKSDIIALRVKKGNVYFLGFMSRSTKIAFSFADNLGNCMLRKESVLCETLQDSIGHILTCESFTSELMHKFKDSPSSVAKAFLRRVKRHKRKKISDLPGHDIFMVSDTEFNNIVDALRDGDYIFVIKDNDPADEPKTNCYKKGK